MPTATTSRLGCKYKILGAFARVGIACLQFRWSAQNVLVSASHQRAAPRSQSTKLRAGARSQVRPLRGSATRRARISTKATHSASGSNKACACCCSVQQVPAPGPWKFTLPATKQFPPKMVVAFAFSTAISVLSVLSFASRHCWLTNRSTGHFAAVRVRPSFHSWPNTARRKVPVSSNVRPRKTAAPTACRNGRQWRPMLAQRLGH